MLGRVYLKRTLLEFGCECYSAPKSDLLFQQIHTYKGGILQENVFGDRSLKNCNLTGDGHEEPDHGESHMCYMGGGHCLFLFRDALNASTEGQCLVSRGREFQSLITDGRKDDENREVLEYIGGIFSAFLNG